MYKTGAAIASMYNQLSPKWKMIISGSVEDALAIDKRSRKIISFPRKRQADSEAER